MPSAAPLYRFDHRAGSTGASTADLVNATPAMSVAPAAAAWGTGDTGGQPAQAEAFTSQSAAPQVEADHPWRDASPILAAGSAPAAAPVALADAAFQMPAPMASTAVAPGEPLAARTDALPAPAPDAIAQEGDAGLAPTISHGAHLAVPASPNEGAAAAPEATGGVHEVLASLITQVFASPADGLSPAPMPGVELFTPKGDAAGFIQAADHLMAALERGPNGDAPLLSLLGAGLFTGEPPDPAGDPFAAMNSSLWGHHG